MLYPMESGKFPFKTEPLLPGPIIHVSGTKDPADRINFILIKGWPWRKVSRRGLSANWHVWGLLDSFHPRLPAYQYG
jgi:hypothetical protein